MSRSDSLRIRRATLGDLDAVALLERNCFALDAQSRRSLHHLIDGANAEMQVAVVDGRVLGDVVVLYRRGARVARVYSIAVDSAARGYGVGAALLAVAESGARARGCRTLRAEARVSNTASRGLFARAGYREVGRLAGYYAGGEDGVRLEKWLTGRFYQE